MREELSQDIDEKRLAAGDGLGPDVAHALMQPLLDHYIKLHQVVHKKLGHAKTATQHGLETVDADENSELPKKLQELDTIWDEILSMFREAGLSTQDLEEIEKNLMLIPCAIKQYYQELIERDKALTGLIDEITAGEYTSAYEQAKKITEQLQGVPNLMSGLGPKDYEDQALQDSTDEMRRKAFKIVRDHES